MAKLIEISTQRIDRFSSLPHELLTHPKSDSPSLLIDRLGFDEPHGRTQGCFDNRLSIGSVILLPPQKRFT